MSLQERLHGLRVASREGSLTARVSGPEDDFPSWAGGHSAFNDHCVADINALPPITTLDLSYLNVSPECGQAILHNMHKFTKLDLVNVNIGESQTDGAFLLRLALNLRNNTSIRALALNNMGVTDSVVEHIAAALQTNTTLETLNLAHNVITDAGLMSLANALAGVTTAGVAHPGGGNHGLRELYLSDTEITDGGVQYMLERAPLFKTLQEVSFDGWTKSVDDMRMVLRRNDPVGNHAELLRRREMGRGRLLPPDPYAPWDVLNAPTTQ
jgi:hypothetical protein